MRAACFTTLALPVFLLFASPLLALDTTLPANAHQLYQVIGRGVQIYTCRQENGAWHWVFQSPEATLSDAATGKQLGAHGAGPSWTWSDGSSIVGKVMAKAPAPDGSSIPWLLVETTPDGTTRGALSPVTRVRRSDTHGGSAPAGGCDENASGHVLKVPYTATYTFYSPVTTP